MGVYGHKHYYYHEIKESGIYSIDLFYKCLYKKELITKEQYKIVSDFRKKDVPKFMAKYSFMGEDYLNDFVID